MSKKIVNIRVHVAQSTHLARPLSVARAGHTRYLQGACALQSTAVLLKWTPGKNTHALNFGSDDVGGLQRPKPRPWTTNPIGASKVLHNEVVALFGLVHDAGIVIDIFDGACVGTAQFDIDILGQTMKSDGSLQKPPHRLGQLDGEKSPPHRRLTPVTTFFGQRCRQTQHERFLNDKRDL